jgi:hypothetical protein
VTKEEALKALEDAEVVPCVSAGIADAKEVLSACLAEDIPARGEPPSFARRGPSREGLETLSGFPLQSC